MRKQCRQVDAQVTERKVTEETALREMQMQIERARRVRELYRESKDVEIEAEAPEPAETPSAEPPAPEPREPGR
jgi:hypothetical protein